ncbi:hypothetical protein [Streptomyces sp. V3I7]|uniref:hypothetical protein n=1 Tax=Streptomyces sp. V3I7 TaxID=3042278 RepID=UPI00278481CE|nr:hypothetical protein [Streptomyces sp. V3I7]MDQ0988950.1 hypothetical protein [Streptomyces sp. V3I7]
MPAGAAGEETSRPCSRRGVSSHVPWAELAFPGWALVISGCILVVGGRRGAGLAEVR